MHPDLTKALAVLLDGVSRKELAAAAQKLSAGYRRGATSQAILTPVDAAAYAVARMPATTAACAAVFARLAGAMPGFTPASLLDVGAGTGAASWAAIGQWAGITSVTMLDHNPALRALARKLADSGALAAAEILSGDLRVERRISNLEKGADLVVASYVLAELPEEKAAATAVDLWQSAGFALALIEPGTPDGFARIRSARAALIAAGAHVAAPCTHDALCPVTGRSARASGSDQQKDWCHFSQRLPRSRDHMLLKDASVPFEDERYSYVAVTREKVSSGARIHDSRILAPPLETKPGLTFKLCDEDGLRAQFVAARDKDAYRRVRKRGWGDLF
ncbi:MAG TPA: small ribosomal subunit Rsm22 family protein [Rhizomicrobium sp.]|nr:small ribosomal subunit Rsm22 family protein [Rhizomicrobium sp.]